MHIFGGVVTARQVRPFCIICRYGFLDDFLHLFSAGGDGIDRRLVGVLDDHSGLHGDAAQPPREVDHVLLVGGAGLSQLVDGGADVSGVFLQVLAQFADLLCVGDVHVRADDHSVLLVDEAVHFGTYLLDRGLHLLAVDVDGYPAGGTPSTSSFGKEMT